MKVKRIPLKNYKKLNLTQSQIAEKTGLTQGRISHLVNSKKNIVLEIDGDSLKIVSTGEPKVHGRAAS